MTAMLCAKFHNDLRKEINIMEENVFAMLHLWLNPSPLLHIPVPGDYPSYSYQDYDKPQHDKSAEFMFVYHTIILANPTNRVFP